MNDCFWKLSENFEEILKKDAAGSSAFLFSVPNYEKNNNKNENCGDTNLLNQKWFLVHMFYCYLKNHV